MSENSKIEWTDATWNPVTGCTKVSEGCRNCYALTFSERWRGTPGHYFENGFDLTLRPDKLVEPVRWKKPKRIFVNSMSDLFHQDVPQDFIDKVFAVMALAPRHTFQLLTKRPQRMLNYMKGLEKRGVRRVLADAAEEVMNDENAGFFVSNRIGAGATDKPGWPLKNLWIGVSVENQKVANDRIPVLLETPAAVRFLSCEPLLGSVDLFKAGALAGGFANDNEFSAHGNIDWVIAGGESGHDARPMHPDWARWLRDQCEAAGVPFHFKQWGEWHPLPWKQEVTTGKGKYFPDIDWTFVRLGKKYSGRLLDKRTWDEMPEMFATQRNIRSMNEE